MSEPEPQEARPEEVTDTTQQRRGRPWLLVLLVLVGVSAVGWLVAGQFGSRAEQGHGHEQEPTYAARVQPMSLGKPWVDPATKAAESQILDAQFADAAHGFALTGGCESKGTRCWYGLRATSDSGQTWAYRELPAQARSTNDGFSAALLVLGTDTVSLEDKGRSWFSSDAGETWREVKPKAGLTYATIPDAALLRNVCAADGCKVRATDPRTGATAPLKSQPALEKIWWLSPEGDTVGGWWIAGAVDDRTPAVAVSRDQGRTWQVSRLKTEATQVIGVSLATRSGQEAYLFAVLLPKNPQAERPSTGRVYESHDSGRTWSTLEPSGDKRKQPGTVAAGLLLGPDRLLLGTQGSGTRISEDGGRSFADLPNVPEFASFPRSRGRYVARSTGGFYTSLDGVGWGRLQFAA